MIVHEFASIPPPRLRLSSCVVKPEFLTEVEKKFEYPDFSFAASFVSLKMGSSYPLTFLQWVVERFPNLQTLVLHGTAAFRPGIRFPTVRTILSVVPQTPDF